MRIMVVWWPGREDSAGSEELERGSIEMVGSRGTSGRRKGEQPVYHRVFKLTSKLKAIRLNMEHSFPSSRCKTMLAPSINRREVEKTSSVSKRGLRQSGGSRQHIVDAYKRYQTVAVMEDKIKNLIRQWRRHVIARVRGV